MATQATASVMSQRQSNGDADPVEVAVVGPGRMGVGMANAFAVHDYAVSLIDTKDRPDGEEWVALRQAEDRIRSQLQFLNEHGAFDVDVARVIDNITFTRSIEDGLAGAEWVFEALPEEPAVKAAFFEAAEAELSADAVIATTTSSISIEEYDDLVEPSRFIITNWWNPPEIIPLVEVAKSPQTAERVVDRMVALLEDIEKKPLVCADTPGFIGARVQAAAMNEAIRAYEEGVASVETIDQALRAGFGFRLPIIGMLEFVDLGGVDILYHVNEYLAEELGDRFENPETVTAMVERNELGPKTGTGFYDYEDVDVEAYQQAKYRGYLDILDAYERFEAEEAN